MGDYERTTTVHAGADDLFQYLSKVDNLPQYMHRLTEAHTVGGDRVAVEARVPESPANDADGDVRAEAWFRVDADARTVEWGAENEDDYRGRLTVTGDGTTSTVEVHLHTMHDDPGIERGIDETLQNIEQIVGQTSSSS